MNGPEHYKESERLLDLMMAHPSVRTVDPVNLAAAQVHATLALAAATVDAAASRGPGDVSHDWLMIMGLVTE